MKWDWMIAPHASLVEQLVLDALVPLLIVLLFRTRRFYTNSPLVEHDPSYPHWIRNLWKYLLALLYVWFFAATIWHFLIVPH
jgi:hypothetical protein